MIPGIFSFENILIILFKFFFVGLLGLCSPTLDHVFLFFILTGIYCQCTKMALSGKQIVSKASGSQGICYFQKTNIACNNIRIKFCKKKSFLTSPILAAYETFEMDFDLGKKYGRLLTKR